MAASTIQTQLIQRFDVSGLHVRLLGVSGVAVLFLEVRLGLPDRSVEPTVPEGEVSVWSSAFKDLTSMSSM